MNLNSCRTFLKYPKSNCKRINKKNLKIKNKNIYKNYQNNLLLVKSSKRNFQKVDDHKNFPLLLTIFSSPNRINNYQQ